MGPSAGASDFGALLRRCRVAAGLTQEALAERSGLSAQAISALECGWRRRPHQDTVAMLADALELGAAEREMFAAVARPASPRGPQQPPAPAAVLPVPATPLVGRQSELSVARKLLSMAHVRLLNVTGPPGVGKTRLALALAEGMAPGTAVFVDLAPVAEARDVLPTVGRALGLPESSSDSPVAELANRLAGRRLLLVLDNLEHLLPAAPGLGELLSRCPQLRLLTTSRAVLRVRGEHELLVRPPPLEDAVTLFSLFVQARSPGFEVTGESLPAVIDVCRRLDHLPLALELAAPWVSRIGLDGLRGRLDLEVLTGGALDVPEHQRTMLGTLAWSYRLLAADEQALLRSASVFAGSASLAALEAVTDQAVRPRVLDLAARLVDLNLLYAQNGAESSRFGMLTVIQEYGRRQLVETGEAAAAARAHARYFADLAAAAEVALTRPGQAAWMERLEREHDNVRTALRWAWDAGEADAGMRMAGSMWRFWERSEHLREGLAWVERWLAGGFDVAPATRALAQLGAGSLAMRLGKPALAIARLEASLALWEELGDDRRCATALNLLSTVTRVHGELERATRLGEASLVRWRQVGDRRGIAVSLTNLAATFYVTGEHERAAALMEEALEIVRALDDRYGLVATLNNLGEIALRSARLDRAEGYLREAVATNREMGMVDLAVSTLSMLGDLARLRGDSAGAEARYLEGLGVTLETGHTGGAVTSVEGLAASAWMRGDAARAAALYVTATAMREDLDAPAPLVERQAHDPIRTEVRRALGDEAWSAVTPLSMAEVTAGSTAPDAAGEGSTPPG